MAAAGTEGLGKRRRRRQSAALAILPAAAEAAALQPATPLLLPSLPSNVQRHVFRFAGRDAVEDWRRVALGPQRSIDEILDARVKYYLKWLYDAQMQHLRVKHTDAAHYGWLAILEPVPGTEAGYFDMGDWYSSPPGSKAGPAVYDVHYGQSLTAVLHNVRSSLSYQRFHLPDFVSVIVLPIDIPDIFHMSDRLRSQIQLLPGANMSGYHPGWFAREDVLEAAERTPGRNHHERWFNSPELIQDFHISLLMKMPEHQQDLFLLRDDAKTGEPIDFTNWPGWRRLPLDVVDQYALERALKIHQYPTTRRLNSLFPRHIILTRTEEEERDTARKAASN